MKLGPVTKINKGSKTASKKFDDNVIVDKLRIYPIYGFRTHSL